MQVRSVCFGEEASREGLNLSSTILVNGRQTVLHCRGPGFGVVGSCLKLHLRQQPAKTLPYKDGGCLKEGLHAIRSLVEGGSHKQPLKRNPKPNICQNAAFTMLRMISRYGLGLESGRLGPTGVTDTL
eukprot:5578836-Amphidinium_carterae.1